ncbi:fungal-specific transcription factor domain-containing protein [Lipomyces kononenkoae]|uniref:Fungal-specific transcription factor domain-containing protein n=1 Tax=Lipomyces kononenkoae TaxID=34357 RepID=A0ACC3SQ50_LIPKO
MPPYQPFQCHICLTRFTRHENLKRHAAIHSRSQDATSLSCDVCQATFSRPDLRRRHMKVKHRDYEPRRANPENSRVCSLSPTQISDKTWDPQHSDDEGELEMDSEIWQKALRYARCQLDHDDRVETPASPDRRKSQLNLGSLMKQPPTGESACAVRIVQDTTDLERTLMLGTSLLQPIHHLDSELHPITLPQSTTYDTNLTGYNFDPLHQIHDDWSPSALQIKKGCDLFFTHVSPFVPFLHKPTFDATQIDPDLLLSILCLAYQYGEDPNCGDQPGSGVSLSRRCFHRGRELIVLGEGKAGGPLHMVQSCLLLQLCAMMYLCGDDSAYGLKLHSHMISLARAGGLMQPMSTPSTATEDLESLWRAFLTTESHRRTAFAVHQIDALWYQFLSIPRSISHLEIKHDLPCPEIHWAASSPAEWAHRRLIAGNSSPGVQYVDVVRRFLTPDADLNSIPPFDPYGAINIAQFLISSAREISGWSMMTGMLSIDRFGALRSSLVALNPFICPHSETPPNAPNPSFAATWETAMLELQIWSPSHTGGIIVASLDTFLSQLTYLAPSSGETLRDASTVEAIQPHVDWFLRYLDADLVPDCEAPWIAVYAYKAFLIAWQLVRARSPGAMQVVGVHDGDLEGALMWARRVFRHRDRWQFGKFIISSLDKLEN